MVGGVGYRDSKGGPKAHAVFCSLDADSIVAISVHIAHTSVPECNSAPVLLPLKRNAIILLMEIADHLEHGSDLRQGAAEPWTEGQDDALGENLLWFGAHQDAIRATINLGCLQNTRRRADA